MIAGFFAQDAEWLAPPGNATAAALGATHHMVGREAVVHFLTIDFPRSTTAIIRCRFCAGTCFHGTHRIGPHRRLGIGLVPYSPLAVAS
ncbi:hypothetical protein [Nonomuraea sp. SYSU D8015]|uniref:hypothetical protein n=1 Tax=Nonomuraea sp. SYSU D8015 TaxID=2593644 RepID=UPI001CB6D851|nr:hypothetical protein [Nonomuraea sp. SYSU D8015]